MTSRARRAIIDLPHLRDRVRVFRDRQRAGEVVAAMLAAYRGTDAVVMVNAEIGSGRVVGMGGHDLYMNKWLQQSKPAENAKSMVFVLDWLTKQ